MSDYEVSRFEYKLWFEGAEVSPMEIAKAISDFIISKGGSPIRASYGTIRVPVEDIGESFDE